MFKMGAARNEGDLHVRQRRTGQHAKVLLFFQMGQHKALPVLVQHFFPAVGGKLHPAAAGQGFQLDMHLRIMAQRLVVAHALHRLRDGLLVQNAAGAELHVQAKALCQQTAQHFQLHLTHELHMDLAQSLVPYHMELRLLFFQPVQLAQCRVHISPLRQQHLIAQHRFQNRHIAVAFRAKALARARFGQAGDGAHLPRADGFRQRILYAGVQPQLVCLFLPRLTICFAGELGLYLQFAASHAQPCQARALLILRHLKHLGAKGIQRGSRTGIAVDAVHQSVHAFQCIVFGTPQRRTEPAREHMPACNGRDEVRIGQLPDIQHPIHQVFVTQSQCFVPVGLRHIKGHKALAQTVVQLGEQLFPALAGQIHLVHEHKGGHMVAPQQPPERLGVALHTVGAAYHQHSIVQHLQGALCLGGKIHMAGGVQQCDIRIARRQQGLLGKDGDAARFFKRVGIQKGILVIHAAQLADRAGAVEHGFRKGGLAGVHMGKDAQNDLFMRCFHPLLLQSKIHFYCSTDGKKRKVFDLEWGRNPKTQFILSAFHVKKQLWKIRRFSRAVNIRITIPLFIAKANASAILTVNYSTMMLLPVISAGTGRPIYGSMVGAISARQPPSRSFTSPQPTATKGTTLVVCAVKGVPSGFIIFSALPWSAVMKAQPPAFSTADTT